MPSASTVAGLRVHVEHVVERAHVERPVMPSRAVAKQVRCFLAQRKPPAALRLQ